MAHKNLKFGETLVVAAVKPTDLNPIQPAALALRESTLMNIRLDTVWTYLSQLGLPVESFIFSKAEDNARSSAKIILIKDYYVKIDVKYIEPLFSYGGKTDAKYLLYKGNQKLAEGKHIRDIQEQLKALPICRQGIITQNR